MQGAAQAEREIEVMAPGEAPRAQRLFGDDLARRSPECVGCWNPWASDLSEWIVPFDPKVPKEERGMGHGQIEKVSELEHRLLAAGAAQDWLRGVAVSGVRRYACQIRYARIQAHN